MNRFLKKFEKTPLTNEEWKEIRGYQQLSLHKKLALLDRFRSFMFEVWRQNPGLYRKHQKQSGR